MKCHKCGTFILLSAVDLVSYKPFPIQPDTATYFATGECLCGKSGITITIVYPQKKD